MIERPIEKEAPNTVDRDQYISDRQFGRRALHSKGTTISTQQIYF